jgi:protein phosphatase
MLFVEVHATSHVGRVRKGNEDNYLLLDADKSIFRVASENSNEIKIHSEKFEIGEGGLVLAVSDGMGGALAGEVASKMTVETIGKYLLESKKIQGVSLIERLYEATLYANHVIHTEQRTRSEYSGMGATLTGVSITSDAVDIVQIGDSRAYLVRNAQIYQLTKDQSLVQQLVDAKQIKPEEAETHIMKNVILQALGAQSEVYPVVVRLYPQRGDILLICSDGLSNKLRANDLLRVILDNLDDLKNACFTLVKEANERGGEDNITAVLARLTGSDLPEPIEEEIKLEHLEFESIHDTSEENTGELA